MGRCLAYFSSGALFGFVGEGVGLILRCVGKGEADFDVINDTDVGFVRHWVGE